MHEKFSNKVKVPKLFLMPKHFFVPKFKIIFFFSKINWFVFQNHRIHCTVFFVHNFADIAVICFVNSIKLFFKTWSNLLSNFWSQMPLLLRHFNPRWTNSAFVPNLVFDPIKNLKREFLKQKIDIYFSALCWIHFFFCVSRIRHLLKILCFCGDVESVPTIKMKTKTAVINTFIIKLLNNKRNLNNFHAFGLIAKIHFFFNAIFANLTTKNPCSLMRILAQKIHKQNWIKKRGLITQVIFFIWGCENSDKKKLDNFSGKSKWFCQRQNWSKNVQQLLSRYNGRYQ